MTEILSQNEIEALIEGMPTGNFDENNKYKLEERIDLIKYEIMSSFTRRLSKITDDYLSDKVGEDYLDNVTEELFSDYRKMVKSLKQLDLGIRKLSCEKSYSLA